MKAIILAAGKSERFGGARALPKQLLELGSSTLIEHVVQSANQLGVDDMIIVTNSENHSQISAVLSQDRAQSISLRCIVSQHASLGNGASFFDSLQYANDDCYVLMSDHVFSQSTIDQIAEGVQSQSAKGLPILACDPNIADIFDLEDATKVLSCGPAIQEIGKDLSKYNLIDMGIFWFPKACHQLIQQAFDQQCYSLTEIVRYIIANSRFCALPIKQAVWQDIDDQSMLDYAQKLITNTI